MPEENNGNNEAIVARPARTPATQGTLVQYSGPLPPASEFARYEDVLPGSADRIIRLAEGQSKHRQFIEKIVIGSDALRSMAGLLFAAAIVGGGMYSGVYLIMHDKSTAGFVAILGPLLTVAAAFIYQQSKKKSD